MKAREIKKLMLEDYELSIREYEGTTKAIKVRIKTEEGRIRHLEYQLKNFFGVDRKYEFIQ